jgi:Ca2+-binding RTX toxin-like protein
MAAPVPITSAQLQALGMNDPKTLLGQLYAQFMAKTGATIQTVDPGSGTSTLGLVISIDRSWIDGSNKDNTIQFAQMIVAHELAHAVVPGGNLSPNGVPFNGATNPDDAVKAGIKAEGEAYLTEYIVALQVAKAANLTAAQTSKLLDQIPPPVLAKLQKDLKSLNVATITSISAMQGIANYAKDVTDAGTAAAGLSLGGKGGYKDSSWTYQRRWMASWLIDTVIGLTESQYNLKQAPVAQESGNATKGWTFSGNSIPLLDAPNATHPTFAGEQLSYTFTESPSGVFDGVMTWTVPVPKGSKSPLQATIEGGFGGNDTLHGLAGTDTFLLDLNRNPNKAPTETLDVFPSSTGAVTINTGSGITVLGTTAITWQTDAQQQPVQYHWTDGTYNYVFVPWNMVPKQDQRAGTNVRLTPNTGELVVTAASGSGATIDLVGFNLQQAEAGGFLGIQLPNTLTFSEAIPPQFFGTFLGGTGQGYELSVDTSQSSDRVITVSLAGAAPEDFYVVLQNGMTEQINGDHTFNVTLSGGQTGTFFDLVDQTKPDGSSDLATGGQLKLAAAMPNGPTSGAPPIVSGSITETYTPAPVDTTKPPAPVATVTGQLNSQSGVTTYTGDGNDDLFVATGAKNLVIATNSGNDSFVGGTGTNTIIGSAGNDVFSLGGTQDFVQLGGGFNTINGGAGQEEVASTAGDALFIGNGGTDVVLLGNGENQVFAYTQTSLGQAISQGPSAGPAIASAVSLTAASAATQQGDLLAVGDGNNTIIGSNKNDLIAVGAGDDMVVMGSGSDTFIGGIEITGADYDWTAARTGCNSATCPTTTSRTPILTRSPTTVRRSRERRRR